MIGVWGNNIFSLRVVAGVPCQLFASRGMTTGSFLFEAEQLAPPSACIGVLYQQVDLQPHSHSHR